MLTTTRREIINDYEVSQSRQIRDFADYSYEAEVPTRTMEARPIENYMSRSEIAQKLYGADYSEHYETDNSHESYSDPDLMPSMATMQITRSQYYQQPMSNKAQTTTKQCYSARSKILIASYAAVILALALILTLTIVSVCSLFVGQPAPAEEQPQEVASIQYEMPQDDVLQQVYDIKA